VLDRQRNAGVDDAYSDFRSANNGFNVGGGVTQVAIMGPYNPTGTGDTPSRRRIFTCTPTAASEETCARSILSRLARHAYRGPVVPREVDTLIGFYKQGRARGDFETGMQEALARLLVAPRFLYRTEEEPASVAAGAAYRISDTELASRLSFFLWSSIPDQELLDLAAKNRLRDSATLQRQVKRMIADPKADAFIENFAGQWLYLRDLANFQTEAVGFDANLRRSLRRPDDIDLPVPTRADELPQQRRHIARIGVQWHFLKGEAQLATRVNQPRYLFDFFSQIAARNVGAGECLLIA